MSITAKELAYAAISHSTTRHFRHLLPVPRFIIRAPRLPGQSGPKDTRPKDRIQFWNIVPGDFVRLRGDSKGTIHEVSKVNKISNRVLLRKEVNKPDLTGQSAQTQGTKSVPYSQCQLLVGKFEYPPQGDEKQPQILPVFASRLTASQPYWSNRGYWVWRRYAVKTTPLLPNMSKGNSVTLRVPWPKRLATRKPEAGLYDTAEEAVNEVTYSLPPLPSKLLSPAPKVPLEHEYITSLRKSTPLPSTAAVEIYLHKELSNPHSRAKKQERWQAHRVRSLALLQEYIATELKELGGRTRKEARAEATWKWQQRVRDDRKAELRRRAKNRGEDARAIRKAIRKSRKARRTEEKLRTLVLPQATNQIIPSSTVAA